MMKRLRRLASNSMALLVITWMGLCGTLAQTNAPNPVAVETQAANAPQLANSVRRAAPGSDFYLTFGLDRIEWLQTALFGNPLWKYLASLFYILLAFYASKLVDLIFNAWFKRWVAKPQSQLNVLLVKLVNGPVKVVLFVILLHVGLNIFDWPLWVKGYLSNGLKIIVAASLTYVAVKCVDMVMHYWMGRMKTPSVDKSFHDQIFPVLNKGAKIFVVIVAVLMTSQNLGLNITGALASLSIGGLALGLAAQDTLANMFGAIAIFFDKPFQIGDRIQLEGGVDGTVESIGLRSTRVRNLDGFLVAIPNKTMGNATITNVTRRPTIKTVINLGVTYDTSMEKLRQALAILNEIYRGHPQTHDVVISFNKFADFSLNIIIVHWWKGLVYPEYLAGMQDLNLMVKERFEKEGISFAFPTQTIYLKQDSDWNLNGVKTAARDPLMRSN